MILILQRISYKTSGTSRSLFDICVERGEYVEAGSNWLKFHHNQVLSEEEIAALSNSLTTSPQKIQVKSRLISIIE